MSKLKVDFSKREGVIKDMNAVNNGPAGSPVRQTGNVKLYKELNIPYARLHDSAFYTGNYGGEYSVDVHRLFPNFDADENDPASYLFGPTDEYLQSIDAVGTKVFYRLGAGIEHGYKKGTYPPKDFSKWARICEHIIMHYNEGWANGFNMDIEYWEVWNEPDCKNADGSNPCWQGTFPQFYDFFEVVVKYLKNRFPNLKIGGPATCNLWQREFGEGIVKAIGERKIPIDFYSIHWYGHRPCDFKETIELAVKDLSDNGIENVELHLNEWNYNAGWLGDAFAKSMATIRTMKGASFVGSLMSIGQKSKLDMLMYYDARPCGFNGLFEIYTNKPLKSFYTFKAFDALKQLGNSVYSESDEDVFTIASTNEKEKAVLISRFNDEDETPSKLIELELDNMTDGKPVKVDYYLLDNEHDLELIRSEYFSSSKAISYIDMKNFSLYLLKISKA